MTDPSRLTPHPLRAQVLGELHARPIHPVTTPRRVVRYGFMTDAAQAQAARASFQAFCAGKAIPGPPDGAKHHRISLSGTALTWESHGEFTTFTWDMPAPEAGPFHPAAASVTSMMSLIPQPGPLMLAIDVHLIPQTEDAPWTLFDKPSLAVSAVYEGKALIATDFKPDAAGFVRILVMDRGLDSFLAGGVIQRVLEIESYRTFALLGLPEAQRLQPSITRLESELPQVLASIEGGGGFEVNNALLDRLTALSAELERGASESLFRFGATRAYDSLVHLRLEALKEHSVEGMPTWSAFLARRMAPAMRTCTTMEERQANLSRKLTRAAQLLRTRVDIEREKQNSELLKSMNDRGQVQLRLQQTVEGLSVAAISYYVVGLAGYVIKGLKDAGLPLDPSLATAASVPLAIGVIWWLVRRIRRAHMD